MSAATAEAGKYPADVWQNIPRQPRAGRRAVSAQNVMSVRILVNKKRYCRGTQVVNGRVAQIPGECEEMALFLALLNTKILVKPINIQAKTWCSAGSFFKGLESYKCSAFPLFQPFRQWEFWLERIPGPLPDMAQIFCGLQGHPRKREWSVSWALRAATQASAGCQSSQGQGMEQNESKCFVCLLRRHFYGFSHICSHSENGGSASYQLGAVVMSPVMGRRWPPPCMFACVLSRNRLRTSWEMAENWQPKEDLRASKAEIGNWAVVITGCGIDVVPINQNCWINRNCPSFFFFFLP